MNEVVAVLVAVVGLTLLVRSMRGRRVGDEPHCRECDYNLAGLEGETIICPECGGDDLPVLGTRVRSKRLTITGGAILAIALLFGGGMIWQRATGYDWIKAAPTWWLIRAGDDLDYGGARARFELVRRLLNDDLSDSTIDSIVRRAIPSPDEPFEAKHLQWAELVEYAWSKGKLATRDLETYCRRFVDVWANVNVRPRIRTGQPMKVVLSMSPRVGNLHRSDLTAPVPALEMRFQVVDIMIDEAPAELLSSWKPGYATNAFGPAASFLLLSERPVELSPGDHVMSFVIGFGFGRRNSPIDMQLTLGQPWPTQLFEWEAQIDVSIHVIAEDAPSQIEVVLDEALRQEVAAAIEFDDCSASYAAGEWYLFNAFASSRRSDLLQGKPQLAYDIVWRSGASEWIAGAIYSRVGGQIHMSFPSATVTDLDETLEEIDIVLRPNPRVAEIWTTEVSPILGGEIVYENIPLRIHRSD